MHLAAAVPRARSARSASAGSTASSSPFPTHDELEESDLDLIVSGTRRRGRMIEGFAREMPEDEMLEAIMFGHQHDREIMRLAATSCCDKVGVEEAALRRRRPTTGVYDRLQEPVLRRVQARQADRRQARPGRSGQGAQGAGRRRADSRSDGRRRHHAEQVSTRPGTSWKNASSAI